MAVLIPIWRKALDRLGIEAKFVLPFRNPFEVASSLTRRETFHKSELTWSVDRGLLLWLQYVVTAEQTTRDAPRTFVDFDGLLDDWEAEAGRMGEQLGITWPTPIEAARSEIAAFLNPEHKHATLTPEWSSPLASFAKPLYEQLNRNKLVPEARSEAFDDAAAALRQGRILFKDYASDLEQHAKTGTRLEREADDLRNRLERAEAECRDAEHGRLQADQAKSRAEAGLSEQRARADELEQRLRRMQGSLAWKLAAPLRWLAGGSGPTRG